MTGRSGTPRVESGAQAVQLAVLGVAVAVAALVVGWLLLNRPAPHNASPAGPVLLSQSQLERVAAATEHPLYWAGAKPGFSYEVTATTDGRFYVRYLPAGVSAGDPRADFLTVGTYPGATAYADLRRAAKAKGSTGAGLDHHGLLVVARSNPQSAYFGFRGAKYQVEVFDPSDAPASRLVQAGKIVPIR